LIELMFSTTLIAPARSVYVLLHKFFSGELRDAPNSIGASTATSRANILRLTDYLGAMPLTPERIVRIVARRRSHNEFTGVTHSKSRPTLSKRSSKWSPTAADNF
jgi:hypothetical protein